MRPDRLQTPDEPRRTPDDASASTPFSDDPDRDDELADQMSAESFPGSDPPSTWAGADTPG